MTIERREFAKLGGFALLSALIGRLHADRPLKFLVFSDLHYRPGVFPHDTPDLLRRIICRGVSERVDFGIQLGDFIHNAECDSAVIELWRGAPFPTYSVIGNHDDDSTTPNATRDALGLSSGYYYFDCCGFRFIVLDTNYGLVDGRFVHYGADAGFFQWDLKRDCAMRLHPDEFTFLEDAIRTAVGRCVIVSHRALSGEDEDARRVRRIISECHAESPGKVVLAMNGHGHSDSVRFCEGVPYYTVNSPNHCWIPFRHSAYPHEDVVRWKEIGHVVAYSGNPLSAIITMTHNGDISVSGMKGGWWRGICPVDISPRLAGYRITPHIEDRNCLLAQQLSERRGTLAGVSD